jgi:hypothetical protein
VIEAPISETGGMRRATIFLMLLLIATSEAQAQPAALPPALARFADAVTELPRNPSILRGRVYVPAYSSILVGSGTRRLDLSVSLSVHNTSENGTLVIERIDYFNVAGQLVVKYLPRAIALKPYATIQIVVPEEDVRGGLGANFIVDWSSPETIDEPIVEAIMIGGPGTQGYSFISVGRKVSRP